jgi:hypothetical protein
MLGSVRLRGHVAAKFPLARLGAFRAELHATFTIATRVRNRASASPPLRP